MSGLMSESTEQAPDPGQTPLSSSDLEAKLRLLGVAEGEEPPELERVDIKVGEVLFEQGEAGDSMYLVCSGALGVRLKAQDGSEEVIDTLAPGVVVGELAVLSGQERSATVYGLEDASLLRITPAGFEALSPSQQSALVDLETLVRTRWQRLQLAKVVHDLFGRLEAKELHYLQEQAEWIQLSNGHTLFKQGDESDCMYVIVNGRLRFSATAEEGEVVASGEVGPGEVIGEFALFDREPRWATAYAVRETNVVRLSRGLFDQWVERFPGLMPKVVALVIKRAKQTASLAKVTSPKSLTLALVAASPDVDTARFARELAAALGDFDSSLALDREGFDRRFGRPGIADTPPDAPSHPAVTAWIDELEADNAYVVFAADAEPSFWTQRCVGHADRVLVIADPEGDPAPGPAEQALAELDVSVPTELVLWHPRDTVRPTGTLPWLESRDVEAHHHVRQDDAAHMARLARRLSGQGIALVLSGGGGRGFAHMGVHRAFEKLGIPIDYIVGTSMGAVMGAMIESTANNAEILTAARVFDHPRKVLFDPTVPFAALQASKKVTRLMQRLYRDLQLEDLWVPFATVATNLSTTQRVVYERGPLWLAVRASLAIPGVFVPVIDDGDVIVDGGAVDNFPIKLAAELCRTSKVIGVNVTPYKERKREYDFNMAVSGWRLLFNRLNPFSRRLRAPSIGNTVMRTMVLAGTQNEIAQRGLLDLLITPDVRRWGMSDYGAYEELADAGYESALEPLRDWMKRHPELCGASNEG
jgi:predicted acylesterase/phospholipase RssA/CRP-like cAMP-binding protein